MQHGSVRRRGTTYTAYWRETDPASASSAATGQLQPELPHCLHPAAAARPRLRRDPVPPLRRDRQ